MQPRATSNHDNPQSGIHPATVTQLTNRKTKTRSPIFTQGQEKVGRKTQWAKQVDFDTRGSQISLAVQTLGATLQGVKQRLKSNLAIKRHNALTTQFATIGRNLSNWSNNLPNSVNTCKESKLLDLCILPERKLPCQTPWGQRMFCPMYIYQNLL